MSGVLNYNMFSKMSSLNKSVNEGISFSCNHLSNGNQMSIDWDNDKTTDIVKLANPRKTKPGRLSSVQTWAGYSLENVNIPNEPNRHNLKRCFSEYSKNWGSISHDDLKNLINASYPSELKNANIKVLFVMGSSAPLAANMAEALKELYYPKAKIVDIMKAYYADPDNMIDWDKYNTSDETTQRNVNTWLKKFKSKIETLEPDPETGEERWNVTDPPRIKHTGLIKKSTGLQSGGRNLLKPGHTIDDYIIKSIRDEMSEWLDKSGGSDFRIMNANMPAFLTLDDLIIEGSTMRGALSNVLNAMSSTSSDIKMVDVAKRNMYGYVLFSYGKRFG